MFVDCSHISCCRADIWDLMHSQRISKLPRQLVKIVCPCSTHFTRLKNHMLKLITCDFGAKLGYIGRLILWGPRLAFKPCTSNSICLDLCLNQVPHWLFFVLKFLIKKRVHAKGTSLFNACCIIGAKDSCTYFFFNRLKCIQGEIQDFEWGGALWSEQILFKRLSRFLLPHPKLANRLGASGSEEGFTFR